MGAARNGCASQIRELDGRQSLARARFPEHPQGPHSEECTFAAARPEHAPDPPSVTAPTSRPKASTDDAGFEELAHGTSQNLHLQVDGRTLALTHLNKIYFPESGIRKRDLLAYYYGIADHILPFLKDRPLVMRRYPNGIQEQSFFQT